MEGELRRAAVTALGALARSGDHRDRADAGRGLAAFAELPQARGPLLDLVLDAEDTYVTRATAQALLRRLDREGLAIVATALARADESQGEWICTAVADVFGVFADEREAAMRLCGELPEGGEELRAVLADVAPQ